MTLHPIDNDPFYIRNVPIIPVRAMHGPLPIFGFRIGPIGYLTDARNIENKELEKFRDVEIFVVNTVQRMVHRTHFSLSQAIDVAQSIKAPKVFLLTFRIAWNRMKNCLPAFPRGLNLLMTD
jgi:phosphoribosyl 1,2-cyclic phosphate phosphodiesterase